MTNNNRDTSDLSKSSFISHLDIYRENNRAFVMPGFVSDDDYASVEHGLRDYDIQAFNTDVDNTSIYALGKKLDGTGSKIFQREYTDSQWKIPTISSRTGEGTANLVDYPFLYYDNPEFYYPVDDTDGSGVWIAELGPNAIDKQDDDWQTYRATGNVSTRFILRSAFNGTTYFANQSYANGLYSITGSGIASAKTSGLIIKDFATGDYTIGIHGVRLNPRRGQVLLWDAASLLADQNISTGKGNAAVIGYPSNVWATVSTGSTVDEEAQGLNEMTVRVLNGSSPEVFYKLQTVSEMDQVTDVFGLNDSYRQAMTWYAKCEVATSSYKEGIWAFGKGSINSNYGASMLLDTSSLGLVRNTHINGNAFWFIHNENGSISRLDNYLTGTYDVDATIETLFYGADTPFLKSLEGISVVTEDLPSGASVELQYRVDEDDSWVSLGTSSTAGAEVHNFTRSSSAPISNFREAQFKIILSGKVVLKSYVVVITEHDDQPYNV